MSTENELLELAKYCIGAGLNIGCGDIQINGSVGVDINPCAKAASIILDACNLVDIEENCDYIISANCLEHINSGPVLVLREWLRVLKLDGIIAVVVPDAEYGIWAMTGDNGVIGELAKKNMAMEHLHAFTTTTIKLLFEFVGMEVIRCEILDRRPVRDERTIICVGKKMEAYK